MIQLIEEAASRAGVMLTASMAEKTAAFCSYVKEANEKINLTSITEDEAMASLHLEDSWHAVRHIPVNARLIDIGTGAGFPGMALALVRTDLELVLLDATRKKVEFLTESIGKLGLSHVRAVWGRAEELAWDPRYRDRFDLAIARAVTALPELAELSLPFVRKGGLFIAMKGSDSEAGQASAAILKLKGQLEGVDTYELSGLDHPRSLVLVRKLEKTPRAYPRRMAAIRKSPLT